MSTVMSPPAAAAARCRRRWCRRHRHRTRRRAGSRPRRRPGRYAGCAAAGRERRLLSVLVVSMPVLPLAARCGSRGPAGCAAVDARGVLERVDGDPFAAPSGREGVWDVSYEALFAGYASGDPEAAAAFVRRVERNVYGLALGDRPRPGRGAGRGPGGAGAGLALRGELRSAAGVGDGLAARHHPQRGPRQRAGPGAAAGDRRRGAGRLGPSTSPTSATSSTGATTRRGSSTSCATSRRRSATRSCR